MRSLRHIFAVAAAVALLTFAASSSALATNAKSIYAEKECSGLMATHSCIVTFSTFRTLRGADWHYQDLSRLALEPAHDRRPVTRLVVKSRGQTLFLDAADVDWIEAANYYACLHVGGVTHILRRSLQALEKELDEKMFARIHRSIIVNCTRVRGIELHSSGEYEVVLDSEVRLQLSRRFRKSFQDRM